MNTPDLAHLQKLAAQIRGRVIELSHSAKTPHLGSSLSCIDILVAAYWHVVRIDPARPADPNRDRFILSKGHAAPALYATLAYRGILPHEQLATYCQFGSYLPEQPTPGKVPGIEAATGSLGHGLPMAVGMALAAKIQRQSYRTMALLSDGECNEGSVWEAAMMAPAQKLDNLLAIVDFNGWQATGRSTEVLALEPFKQKWEAFGWQTYEIDGHDMAALLETLSRFPSDSGKPMAIVAKTIKGKGVSFMQDDNNWHYKIPNADELAASLVELGVAP